MTEDVHSRYVYEHVGNRYPLKHIPDASKTEDMVVLDFPEDRLIL